MNNVSLSGWAKAVLALSNLVFLVLDTTSLKRDSDIIRVLVVSLAGEELYCRIVKPVRHPNEPNSYYTGITQEQLDQATTLAEQWPAIQAVLAGKFVLAYGLDFVQERLADNAQASHVEPVYLVGDCLYHTASHYCHRNSITLAQACAHVGFPRYIGPNAVERAMAQIALLKAMADGHPQQARPAVCPAPMTDSLQDDDHPF